MTDDEITELLFVCEDPVPADLVMVFAAANELDLARRTRRGVELYQAGYVPKVLVTGGGVLARNCPEAKRMAEIAQALGVPAPDLLVEGRSANTFDNLRLSVDMLNDCGLLQKLESILLVSSEWHMRRVLLTARRYCPSRIRLVCCPTCEGCKQDNWTAWVNAAGKCSRRQRCWRHFLQQARLMEILPLKAFRAPWT